MEEEERPLSASKLGREHGLTGQEMNQVLLNKGFLSGEPGAYSLTDTGKEFGAETDHDNGYGGWARRDWTTTHFSPRIRDEIEVSDDDKQQARDALSERRAAQAAEQQRRIDEPYGSDGEEVETSSTTPSLDWRALLVLGVAALAAVGGSIGVKKLRERRKRKQAAAEQTAEVQDPIEEIVDAEIPESEEQSS